MKVVWLRAKSPDAMATALNRVRKRTALIGQPMLVGKKWVAWLQTEDKDIKSGDID